MAGRKASSRTTTTEALLGLLSLGAMSGYEIRQLIPRSIGNFWNESYGQIYPALKALVADGLAEMKDETDPSRREKKVYALTERGQERLKEWLRMPVMPQVPRNELLLKLFFGDQADAAKLWEMVQVRRDSLASNLARYEAIAREISEKYADRPGLPFWLMTSRYGQVEAKALIAWCDECLEIFKEMR